MCKNKIKVAVGSEIGTAKIKCGDKLRDMVLGGTFLLHELGRRRTQCDLIRVNGETRTYYWQPVPPMEFLGGK